MKDLLFMLKALFLVWAITSFLPPSSRYDQKMRDLSMFGLILICMHESKEKKCDHA